MSAAPNTNQLTVEALKLFDGFTGKTDLVRTYVEAANNFTHDELKAYAATFVKFDANKSGDLDEIELNRMYEARGEPKTRGEILEIIKSIGDEFGASLKKDGVTLSAYFSVLLKDKKGQTKTSWGSFAVAAKKHDATKATGKISNIFEQKAAEAGAEEARIKADIEMRRANKAVKEEEAKAKAKRQAALAKFNANLNSGRAAE